MGQSEFSVAGATGNSNALVTVKSAVPFLPAIGISVAGGTGNLNALVTVKNVVPFLPASPPVSNRLFLLGPFSLRYERNLSTDQKGTASSLF